MATNKINTKNPYRIGSQLHNIFQFMADGNPHTLEDITKAIYPYSITMWRRRVSSALRTIRSHPHLHVTFDLFSNKRYQLIDFSC